MLLLSNNYSVSPSSEQEKRKRKKEKAYVPLGARAESLVSPYYNFSPSIVIPPTSTIIRRDLTPLKSKSGKLVCFASHDERQFNTTKTAEILDGGGRNNPSTTGNNLQLDSLEIFHSRLSRNSKALFDQPLPHHTE